VDQGNSVGDQLTNLLGQVFLPCCCVAIIQWLIGWCRVSSQQIGEAALLGPDLVVCRLPSHYLVLRAFVR